VGLVQRVLEAAGIATVSLSMLPALTASVGAPRVAAIAHPMGLPLGRPGDADGQRAVLRAALSVLSEAQQPGAVVTLPFSWPVPLSRARTRPPAPPPIAQLIARRPWLFFKLRSGQIP
jgi:D-proline reductase (dithiol) PrdB